MDLKVLPLHRHPEHIMACCTLINEEWKRSETARLRSLESSRDNLPTCLILLEQNKVIGHCKLSIIPSIREACFIESVVIDRKLRGKGYGKYLMRKAEDYCGLLGLRTIYLSTHGQEGFYEKLGYRECEPVSIYGSCARLIVPKLKAEGVINNNQVPVPPVMPEAPNPGRNNVKTYMNKDIL